MRDHLGRFTVRKLGVILCVFATILVGLVLFAAVEIKDLKLSYELTGFLAKTDKALQADETLHKKFRLKSDPTVIIVAHRHEGWVNKEALETLERLSAKIGGFEHVRSVTSLATIETVQQTDQDLSIGRIGSDVALLRGLLQSSPLLSPLLLSSDHQIATLIVSVASADAVPLVAELSHSALEMERKAGGITRQEMTGVSLLQSEMSALLNREFSLLGGVGILAAALSLIFLFSGVTGFLIAVLTTLTANLIVLGGLAAFGVSIGVLSLSLPIVIAVQTLSLTVHILFTYLEIRKSRSKNEAVLTSFQRLFVPNLIVSIATGLGFLALAGSPVDAMREFGLTVAAGSMALWLSTTVVAFGLLFLLPDPELRKFVGGRARWVLLFTRNANSTLALFAIATLFAFSTGLGLNYEHRLFDLQTESASAAKVVDQQLGGMIPVEFEIRIPTKQASLGETWMSDKRLAELKELLRKIRDVPGVAAAFGVSDILGLAPNTAPTELISLLEMSAHNPIRQVLSEDQRSARIQVRLRDLSSGDSDIAIARAVNLISKSLDLPKNDIVVAGWGSYIHRMNRELAQSLITGFWEALLAIALVLAFAFRSLRWAIAAIIPSLLPPLVLVAVLSFTGIPVKPGLAVVFAIALGFAFINSIYLLKRLQIAYKRQSTPSTTPSTTSRSGLTQSQAEARWKKLIEKSFWLESQSCLLASLVLIIGFISLCVSEFEVSRSFGVAMVFSMIIGMIGDLVLLPAMLYRFPKFLIGGEMKFFRDSATALTQPIFPLPRQIRVLVLALASGAAFSTAIFSFSVSAANDPSKLDIEVFAREVGKRVYPKDKKLARDESVEIELTNVEPDGQTETRKVEVSRLTVSKGGKTESRILAKVLTPRTLKGTSVLTVTDGDLQNRWIFLPGSKSVRRISGSNETNAPILGSELAVEDLNLSQIDGAQAKILNRANGLVHIETKVGASESLYSKCLAVFDERTYLFKSAECLDRKGQPAKRVRVVDYRILKGKVARPTEMEITNLKTQRVSRVKFSEQKIGVGFSVSDFTPEAMRD